MAASPALFELQPSTLHAEGAAADALTVQQHAAEVEAAYHRGAAQARLESTVELHTREIGEIKGSLSEIHSDVDRIATSVTAVHASQNEQMAVSAAVKEHLEMDSKRREVRDSKRLTSRQLIATAVMACTGSAGAIAGVIALFLH